MARAGISQDRWSDARSDDLEYECAPTQLVDDDEASWDSPARDAQRCCALEDEDQVSGAAACAGAAAADAPETAKRARALEVESAVVRGGKDLAEEADLAEEGLEEEEESPLAFGVESQLEEDSQLPQSASAVRLGGSKKKEEDVEDSEESPLAFGPESQIEEDTQQQQQQQPPPPPPSPQQSPPPPSPLEACVLERDSALAVALVDVPSSGVDAEAAAESGSAECEEERWRAWLEVRMREARVAGDAPTTRSLSAGLDGVFGESAEGRTRAWVKQTAVTIAHALAAETAAEGDEEEEIEVASEAEGDSEGEEDFEGEDVGGGVFDARDDAYAQFGLGALKAALRAKGLGVGGGGGVQ